MKKIKTLIIAMICMSGLTVKSFAQDTLKIKIGLFFNPQGVFKLQKPNDGFSAITPVFAVTSFVKGKSLFNVMYNMTYNNVQFIFLRSFSPKFGMYVGSNKKVLTSGGYSAIGVTRNVASHAVIFCEIGSIWKEFQPTIFAGIAFPVMFRVK